MLYTLATLLLLLWLVGMLTSYTFGGIVHLLLVVALVMLLWQIITGRRVG